MRFLGSIITLVALTASAPALASDYSTDRHFTQSDIATVRRAEASPSTSGARKDTSPCTCSCARRVSDERPTASRVEPGGH
jgi:hypothetical protein